MLDKITNINLIESRELRDNIYKIYDDVLDLLCTCDSFTKARPLVNKLLHNYVLGIGKPISICDSSVYSNHTFGKCDFMTVELLIDYRVTYGYKPYQSLDKPIHLGFLLYEEDVIQHMRNKKIENILWDSEKK